MMLRLIMALLIGLTAPVMAQPSGNKKWKDSAELSYVQTTGNSRTSSFSAKELFNYDWQKAALEAGAGLLSNRDAHTTTAEQYNAFEKASRKLDRRNFLFERTSWYRDRFAGIRNRYEASLGLGRDLLDLPKDKLALEAGPGYLYEQRVNSANKSFFSYRGYVKYIRTLSPTAYASQDLEYLGNMSDSQGYRMNAETALVASVSTHFSLKASHDWHYSNSPAPGFKKTDTLTSMSIIVNY